MTSEDVQVRPKTIPFDERLAILVEELELAVKWQRPCILLAVYSSEYVRADVQAALKNRLSDLGQRSLHLSVRGRKPDQLPAFFKEFKNPRRTVFVIDGFRRTNSDDPGMYATLSLQREYFVERRIRTIFWLTQTELVKLTHVAPEFWAQRHRLMEFVESPKAEQLPVQAMDPSWQGVGELAADVAVPVSAIPMRDSLLTVAPREEESLSIRGNLLLSTSVQSWRQGEFEKAEQLLQEALNIAAKMQDNRFEAECFNALALIKSSTQRIDEAIEAYKQAIQSAPDQVFVWNNLGTLCAKTGRNDEALIAFRKALQANPHDGIAWNGLANVHFQLGYPEDAIVAYRKAIQYTPAFAQPWCGLGDVYASIGRSDDAEKSYRKAIELDKQYALPWMRLGVLFKRQASYREAAKAYQQALTLDASNSEIWNDLGTVHMETESLDEATEAFSKAIELDRSKGWSYSNLALVYMRQGKHKEAVSLLLRSIELLETNADKAASWNRLGSVYRALNDYDNAVAAYQMADEFASLDEVIVENPIEAVSEPERVVEPASVLTNTAIEASTPAEGPQDAAPAAAAAPIDLEQAAPVEESLSEQKLSAAPAWLFERIRTAELVDAGQGTGASPKSTVMQSSVAPDDTNSESLEPSLTVPDASTEQPAENMDAAAWTERGNVLFNRSAFEEAIAAYHTAIQVDPSYGEAYGNLALTYVTQGQFAEAILLYQKSIEYLKCDGDKAISWNGLGNAYRCIGDYAHAVSAYQNAAELDPETGGIRDRADDFQSGETPKNAQAWIDLGEVLLKTGAAEKATETFRKAIELEPQAGAAYANLARSLAAQGKHSEAVPLFERSIELLQDDKEKADALNGLGNSYRKLNDYESAIRSYQKAVVLTDEGVNLLTRTRFSLLSNVYLNP